MDSQDLMLKLVDGIKQRKEKIYINKFYDTCEIACKGNYKILIINTNNQNIKYSIKYRINDKNILCVFLSHNPIIRVELTILDSNYWSSIYENVYKCICIKTGNFVYITKK